MAAQVAAMIAVWCSRDGDIEALTLDAFGALDQREDVTVTSVPEFVPAEAQLECSVAGGYRDSPPTLVVTQSMSVRRQHFTLLHELGHHLQRTDLTLGETVLMHPEPDSFEEAACDAFAARVLLPDDMVASALGGDGPSARSAVELFALSNASRAAISVRLAGLLTSAGVVAVLDETGTITFAASRGGLFPPRRTSDQSANPLVRTMLERRDEGEIVTRSDAHIRYSNGGTSNTLYGQAAWAGDRMIMLMVEEAAPWLSYSPPRDGTATFGKVQVEEPVEPKARLCERCWLVKHPAQFDIGAEMCRECAA
ncbi:ImmA/IrrE family metallo-endopeptidase [Microbacterium sp. KSW4-11]|uniref:ImmA/IrrE family metallo-endopeptidase n=1 Tax=Microbacterium gawkjiense TaxID=3067309 RepID=A0ABU3G754_9MICO|nr:ImmA/IrrE family metallo-endopeptidase [Microbacterium sp. KSW4-11]MDT3315655.1 ImmA/IrrE family metallo-endopeptidase [Microbacterium sp. KSW4-11]